MDFVDLVDLDLVDFVDLMDLVDFGETFVEGFCIGSMLSPPWKRW